MDAAVEKSHQSDLNRRPAVYKTAALPTELRWREVELQCYALMYRFAVSSDDIRAVV